MLAGHGRRAPTFFRWSCFFHSIVVLSPSPVSAAASTITQIVALAEMVQQKKSVFLALFSVNAEISTLVLV